MDKCLSYCDLMIALCLDGIAASTVAVPWSPNSVLLWVLFTLQGTFEGIINIGKCIQKLNIRDVGDRIIRKGMRLLSM